MTTTLSRLETKKAVEVATIMSLVAREHLALQRLLEQVERSADATRDRRPDSLEHLHRWIWKLYLAVDDHLFLEEKYVVPLFETEAAVKMVLEHNEQRDALLKLVEDSEADLRPATELADEAIELVVRLRSDMVLEERTLASLGFTRQAG